MPTRTEVSSRFAESRERGHVFATVVVCFDDSIDVIRVGVEIDDSGDSGRNRSEAIRAARRLALRFVTEDNSAGDNG
jgi:hypothetical protein